MKELKCWQLEIGGCITGLDAGFRKEGFVLDNSKQKHVKFFNIHQNSHENEVIVAKSGVSATPLNPLWIRPSIIIDFSFRNKKIRRLPNDKLNLRCFLAFYLHWLLFFLLFYQLF